MQKRKFKTGDIVSLTGDRAQERDENYGIQGRVIGYAYNPYETCPIVSVFTPFKFGVRRLTSVEYLSEDWWALVDEPNECTCESLL